MDSRCCNIPRDAMPIIYKYIHRDNYIRCIDEYKRICVPHWNSSTMSYTRCEGSYNARMACPIINNNITRCCAAMWRILDDGVYDYTEIYKLFETLGPVKVEAELPPNY